MRKGANLIRRISKNKREKVSLSKLSIGLECGRSDPSSGLVANPVMGLIADRLIDLGGSAVIGETIEWLGAEHLLENRAKSNKVKSKISKAVNFQKQFSQSKGINLLGNNPGHQNIEAGYQQLKKNLLAT